MYYFLPMMKLYGRFLTAPSDWLMSTEGRILIAKSLKHCRNRYGRAQARAYRGALIVIGCIYPIDGIMRKELTGRAE